MGTKKEELLNRVARFLMLRGSFINNIGLLNGKMGICIFFYKYAKFTGMKHYSDFAGELIDEIYNEIHLSYPRDFKDGLSGIAWGMEYVIRNNFVTANADEVLEDLDVQILERDVRRVMDNSLETGLNGLAHYVLCRCIGRQSNLYIDNSYIVDLIQSLQRNNGDQALISQLIYLAEKKDVKYSFDLLDVISSKSRFKEDTLFENRKLGISENGLTGIALKLLNEEQV